jgi:hypothetical protein
MPDEPKRRWPEGLQEYYSEMNAINNILLNDIQKSIELTDDLIQKDLKSTDPDPDPDILDKLQTWFRLSNRLVISLVEFFCYLHKQLILKFCAEWASISSSEIEKLREHKDDGTPLHLGPKENIKYTMKMMSSVFQIRNPMNYGEGWEAF